MAATRVSDCTESKGAGKNAMKVLLLHEMSGVHTELRNGLRNVGIDADIATFGDGWKRYASDIDLGSSVGGIKSHWSRATRQLKLALSAKKYDIIQVMSPNPFYRPLSGLLERIAFRGPSKLIYMAAGSDAIYRRWVGELAYHPPHKWFVNARAYSDLERMLKAFDAIVPVCWEYKYVMRRAGFRTEEVVPLPVDTIRYSPTTRAAKKKRQVFHPLNRSNLRWDSKGTLLIREAFEQLKSKYGDSVEFLCAGEMNHNDYERFTSEVDIIVDQAYSYSYGMSAAYGLAGGKVVLSGLEEECKTTPQYMECPVINIKPTVRDIREKLDSLLEDDSKIAKLSTTSRQFAEKFHARDKVSAQYMALYLRLLGAHVPMPACRDRKSP